MDETRFCKLCGNKLIKKTFQFGTFKEIVPYCASCRQIETGTTKEIYDSAELFVEKGAFQYFLNMEENERNEQRNVSKICEILNAFYDTINAEKN